MIFKSVAHSAVVDVKEREIVEQRRGKGENKRGMPKFGGEIERLSVER